MQQGASTDDAYARLMQLHTLLDEASQRVKDLEPEAAAQTAAGIAPTRDSRQDLHTQLASISICCTQNTELVVLAETAQLPLLVRWRTRLARFWNSVAAAAEGSLLQCALADNCALAEEMGGVAIARRPWAGQVAAALASVGMGVSLAAPAVVSVKEVAAAGKDAFLAQLADARGSKVKEYVAVTGAGADSFSLPAYLAAIPQRSRWRALTQLRCGSY